MPIRGPARAARPGSGPGRSRSSRCPSAGGPPRPSLHGPTRPGGRSAPRDPGRPSGSGARRAGRAGHDDLPGREQAAVAVDRELRFRQVRGEELAGSARRRPRRRCRESRPPAAGAARPPCVPPVIATVASDRGRSIGTLRTSSTEKTRWRNRAQSSSPPTEDLLVAELEGLPVTATPTREEGRLARFFVSVSMRSSTPGQGS